MSEAIEPFEIQIPQDVLDDLAERLSRTRLPDAIEGSGWDYGTDRAYLEELCEYWREKFDWRAQEARLNRFDHFRTQLDGQNLHFIHAPSKHEDALPLLLIHGWPGSIFEFSKVIEPLSDPEAFGGSAADAFHVVCPSIPGYAFSGPTTQPGWSAVRVADAFAALMARLGYSCYGAQGGDWGGIITALLGERDPDHLAGIHMNLAIPVPPAGVENPMEMLTPEEAADVAAFGQFQKDEMGYFQIQSSKPQTLGYALNDSPAGLAAWLVEKFRTWSDCDGDVERRFSKDDLLTTIMIYWATGTIGSSIRLYCESARAGTLGVPADRVDVPTAFAIFPREVFIAPRPWVESRFNVVRWTEMASGGHFAAFEEPELLVQDVRSFFRDLR
jgi:microsomal epoxide hydrolase